MVGALYLLVSQTDPLSGGAGWVGAGLLGLVLFWLLVIHLPSKDKQIKELIERQDKILETKDLRILKIIDDFDARILTTVTSFLAENKEARKTFADAINVMETQLEHRMTAMIVAMKAEFERLHRQ